MVKLAAAESENSNGETTLDVPTLKTPLGKRLPISPGLSKSNAALPLSKKGLVIHNF
jgi:hypothetical protein